MLNRPLSDSFAHSLWPVHPAGYQISLQVPRAGSRKDLSTQPGRFLSPVLPTSGPRRIYAPLLDHPALFKTFADTPQSPEGIAEFANRYGFLGFAEIVGSVSATRSELPASVAETFGTSQAIRRRTGTVGEPVEAWFSEIGAMADMLRIWEAAQGTDQHALAQRIEWQTDKLVTFRDSVGGCEVIADSHFHPELLTRMNPGDLVFPAKLMVQERTNQKLRKLKVSAQLLWNSNWSALEVSLVPSSLLGCMWLQFARAIGGDKSYRACENCKRWFEIGGGTLGGRSDKRYCCGTCKAAAHAKKRVRARRLYRSGRMPADIAQKLDTPIGTVKGWIVQ